MSHHQNPPQNPGQPGHGGQQPGQQPYGGPPPGPAQGQPGYAPQGRPQPGQAPYPPQGQQSYPQQPGQAPYPLQGQPPYPQQPGQAPQGQPPYAQQPPQPGQAPYAPQGQPQPGQAPYAPQGQQSYPQQPGQVPYAPQGQPPYPQQGPAGQYGPGQIQPGAPAGQWRPAGRPGPQGWGPGPAPRGNRQTRKGGNQIIFLAVGCLAMVAVIGVALALVFGRGDDASRAAPDPLPTDGPTTPSENGTDEGIDAGNGVFVKPATGFIRKSGTDVKGVYLVKQGQGTFWLQVAKGAPGESGTKVLPRLMNSQKVAMMSGTFETGELKQTKPEGESNVSLIATQSWSGSVATQNGTTRLAGFIAIVDNKSGVISAVQVTTRQELASELAPDIDAMMQSVVKSQ